MRKQTINTSTPSAHAISGLTNTGIKGIKLFRLSTALLWREIRAGQMTVIILALVLAVTAAAVISVFSNRLDSGMLNKTTELLGADVRVRSNQPIPNSFYQQAQERGLDTSQWSFFPNGVDSEFINNHSLAKKKFLGPKTVLYTGNVGSGQGLELIIPHVAQRMEGVFKFQIVGDGGTRNLLEKKIIELGLSNVDLFPPVGREQLIQYYDEADILFLHLNDLPVFKRVLPSKIFEYAALGKPIVAGLLGYSAQFVEDNISYAQQFYPTDIDGCVECLHNANMRDIRDIEVQLFVEKFSRKSIMDKMAQHILSIV